MGWGRSGRGGGGGWDKSVMEGMGWDNGICTNTKMRGLNSQGNRKELDQKQFISQSEWIARRGY